MLKLMLLRHAKAEPGRPRLADHDRSLAERGTADAVRAGQWIKHAGLQPDLTICSTARRTRETWNLASEALGAAVAVQFEAAIYEATTARLLTVVRRAPATARILLVVGHNPGLEHLVADLVQDAEPEAAARLALKYPTAGIAVLGFKTANWSQIVPRSAHFEAFSAPHYWART
jgi:phosphohistidine phosphatase